MDKIRQELIMYEIKRVGKRRSEILSINTFNFFFYKSGNTLYYFFMCINISLYGTVYPLGINYYMFLLTL